VTEGACGILDLVELYRYALSRSCLQLHHSPEGEPLFVCSESLSAFTDKHCFCGHKSEAPREAGRGLFA